MLLRLCIGLGILLLAAGLAIPLWISAHRTDLPAPPDASDLAIAPGNLTDADNGYRHLVRAGELCTLGGELEHLRALLSGSERDDAWVSRALRENRRAFAELERAIDAPETVYPEPHVVVETDDLSTALIRAQIIVRLANLESRALRRDGRAAASLERSLFGLRLGAATARARNPQLISAMVSTSLLNTSLREARLAVRELPLDADDSLRLSRELERHRTSPEAWRRAWAGEYSFVKSTVITLQAPPLPEGKPVVLALLPNDFAWQPNRSLALFADRYRAIQRAFSEPCSRGRSAFAPTVGGKLLAEMASGNGVGVALLSTATPNFEKFNLRRCHTEARLTLLQVQIAVHAYGSAPDSLEALVPRYLDRVPPDPFDGEPLRYDRARGLVSSVGWDFAPTPVYGPPSPDDEREPAIYVP